jgi:hypothetical protein
MSKSAIRLLTLAIAASVTVAAPAKAYSAKKHRHVQQSIVPSDPGQAWLPSGPNCPGLARSIDCRTWPPYGDDPDRKASGRGG